MPRNFDPGSLPLGKLRDPRILMRVIIGTLLVANLAMAVVAFKPFGGGADDLRTQQASLEQELSGLKGNLLVKRHLVDKVQSARKDGDGFLAEYVTDEATAASALQAELNRTAQESGIHQLPVSYNKLAIEGSDSLKMVTVTDGFEGTYANVTKYINLLDKSSRFLIIESLTTAAPQQNGNAQMLSVQLKLDTFINGEGGDTQ